MTSLCLQDPTFPPAEINVGVLFVKLNGVAVNMENLLRGDADTSASAPITGNLLRGDADTPASAPITGNLLLGDADTPASAPITGNLLRVDADTPASAPITGKYIFKNFSMIIIFYKEVK